SCRAPRRPRQGSPGFVAREDRPAGFLHAVLTAAVRRQRSHAERSQGLAGQERRTGKGSTVPSTGAAPANLTWLGVTKNIYHINSLRLPANPPRIIRARSSRRVLLSSRSHRI